jgi:hypothetical protein
VIDMRWLARRVPAIAAAVALACGPKAAAPGGDGSAHGPASGTGTAAGTGCAAVRGKIEQLYRTEATGREPSRVNEAVADNTAMAMADCAKDPARFTACIAAVTTAAELDARCLLPIDDEGTEGDKLAR